MEDIIEITIKVDTNDADYLTDTLIITRDDLDEIRPLIEAIKNFRSYKGKDYISTAMRELKTCAGHTYSHNYPRGEYCPREDMGEWTVEEIYPDIAEETFELFEEYCPCGEYGFHSIIAVAIQINPQREVLL